MTATIYHNPNCSKSRATLALLEARAVELNIVEYLTVPPDVATLQRIVSALGVEARDIIRSGDKNFPTSPLADESLDDARLLKALSENPRFLQRPIVLLGDRARIGRPPEAVLELFDT